VRSLDQEEDDVILMGSTKTVALELASSLGVLKLFVAHPKNLVGPLSQSDIIE
jgi:hypothetical protein